VSDLRLSLTLTSEGGAPFGMFADLPGRRIPLWMAGGEHGEPARLVLEARSADPLPRIESGNHTFLGWRIEEIVVDESA
jgi:hypothetical protein